MPDRKINSTIAELKNIPDFFDQDTINFLDDIVPSGEDAKVPEQDANIVSNIQTVLYEKLIKLNSESEECKKLHDLLIYLAEIYPRNLTDPVSQGELPRECEEGQHIIFVSSGYQFILENLLQFNKARCLRAEDRLGREERKIIDPFYNIPFAECDRDHILKQTSDFLDIKDYAEFIPDNNRQPNDHHAVVPAFEQGANAAINSQGSFFRFNPIPSILAGEFFESVSRTTYFLHELFSSIMSPFISSILFVAQSSSSWALSLKIISGVGTTILVCGLLSSLPGVGPGVFLALTVFLAVGCIANVPVLSELSRIVVKGLIGALNMALLIVPGLLGIAIGGGSALAVKVIRSPFTLFAGSLNQHQQDQGEDPNIDNRLVPVQ